VNLGTNWSGRISLKEEHHLITPGAYSVLRCPTYTGFLFGLPGGAISMGELRGFVGVLLLLIAFLMKIKGEENLLSAHFGEVYTNYRERVNKIIPGLW
jgi:protein-S-isoprenylcysteine O-methyltransferase Ste14